MSLRPGETCDVYRENGTIALCVRRRKNDLTRPVCAENPYKQSTGKTYSPVTKCEGGIEMRFILLFLLYLLLSKFYVITAVIPILIYLFL